MESVIGFGEVMVAVFFSFAVALTLEWIGLVWLMRLMPGREAEAVTVTAERAGHVSQGKVVGLSLVSRGRKNAA
ncbi:MAG: hypothetical protein WCD43_11620 [Candidatus Acidiferrales bacterium]